MRTRKIFLKWFCAWGRVTPAFVLLLLARRAEANPTGLTVASGSATAQANGSQLTINTSQNAVLNWSSFNIAAGEQTTFNQPSATSIVVNRITDQNPSQIYGSLQANGIVVLLNSSGFYFGPNSFVSAAGLTISTANCLPPQNAGGAWTFNGPPPLASIVNYGQIKIGNGGDCFFIANKIENHGAVEADGGSIQFAAGQTVTLSERPDGRGMSMAVTLPQGSVDNYGNVIADGGIIAMNAKVVNQNGLVQADSVRNVNGEIELVAADSLNLGANSVISAKGDAAAGGSAGGNVTLKSENFFTDTDGSQIITAGGANGGNGGNVEVSAPNIASLNSAMDASAQTGFTAGEFLLDPSSIILGTTGSGTVPNSGTVASSTPGVLRLNVNTAFANKHFSAIKLQATGDISMDAGTVWDLGASTGMASGLVALQAAGNILLNDGAQIVDSQNWSLTMQAGYKFSNNTVRPGIGSITLEGASAIQLASGAVNLTAGLDITVNSGFIITTGGGSINAHALTGNIDCGSDAQGYYFVPNASSLANAYNLSHGLGGISTEAGGDVNLTAGGNVTSILQGVSGRTRGYYYDGDFVAGGGDYATAGAGAFGSQAGNVNIIAGGSVLGHYVVANGTGNIFAGVLMNAAGSPISVGGHYQFGSSGNAGNDLFANSLALSLIAGGWNVNAAQNINLQEVSNPNGMFNAVGGGAVRHYFNYAASDFVNLNAGNQVDLGGTTSSFLRLDTLAIPAIYPGILDISAGAGGVVLTGDTAYRQIDLFPSPLGSLEITTTTGGSLTSQLPLLNGAPQIFSLILSDSGNRQYVNSTSFGANDHAATPVHLNNEQPVRLNIAGDVNLFSLFSPEAATINVGGNFINSRFTGMNLNAADTTTINVTGDIINRSAFTSVDLSAVIGANVPDLSVLSRSQSSLISVATLLNSIYYNPTTHLLTFQNIPNVSIATVLNLLQHLPVQRVDAQGNLLWLDAEHTQPDVQIVSVLNTAAATALANRFKALGGVPTDNSGLAIGGGGTFQVNAHNIDLGTTAGIRSLGVGLYNVSGNYPLANLFNTGANIVVDATGNLDMFSTSIASLNGGNIYVNADGNIRVGSSDFTVNTAGARGIFSTGLGNVAVYAGGDINVDGSRIAVYDTRPLLDGVPAPSGSLTVVSRNGDITVGGGGSGYVVVSSFYVDPVTHAVTTQTPTIPGTGILQTSYNRNGNVLLEALNGNVIIGAGGVEQLLFKGNASGVSMDDLATLFRLALEGNDAAALAYQNELNGIITGAPVSYIDVYAGYGLQLLDGSHNPILDPFGNPSISAINLAAGTLLQSSDGRNIDATGSGIVGAGTANLKASGGITGNIISFGDVNLDANKNINVNVFGLGVVSVSSASGSISGDIIGVGGINASGGSIDANLESNGSISGETSGNTGFAATQAASNVAAGVGNDAANDVKKTDEKSDDEVNKKKKPIALAQKISRVTVLLPKKN
jgi:filamentous hemagglutinin family protein